MGTMLFEFDNYDYTASTIYCVLYKLTDTGVTTVYNPTSGVFVALASTGTPVDHATYGFNLTESTYRTGYFVTTKSISIDFKYECEYRKQVGGSKSRTADTFIKTVFGHWNGTAEYDPTGAETPQGNTAVGTVGATLTSIAVAGTPTVIVSGPTAPDGTTKTIIQGDTYNISENRSLDWTQGTNTWPTLTGADILFSVKYQDTSSTPTVTATLEVEGSVVIGTGSGKTVRANLTSEETAALPQGTWAYDVQATLSNGHIVTLVVGEIEVIEETTLP